MKANELLKYVDEYNLQELKKYNYDIGPLYELSVFEGKKLSKLYGVDEFVVLVSLALMDSKLPEAVRSGKPKEHVQMSLEAARRILDNVIDLSENKKSNIMHCISEHHGCDSYYSKESEVVANADCYKFLSPKGILMYASILGRRINDFEEEWKQLETKMDEKIKHISLDVAKKELIPVYEDFKKYLKCCKKG